jgi:cell wall-associated NlpC family hydrolase
MKLLNILTSNVVEQGTKFGSMIDPETGVAIGQTIGSLDFSDPTKVVARKPQDVHLSEVGKKIISAAESQIGQPYVDCSGLVTWAYNQAGVSIPRGTAQTFFDSSEKVEKENVKVGDLIFFDASTERAGVDHIGIVHNVDNNGNIDMIHASTGSGVVIEKNILNGYYGRVLKGFGRMPQTKS